MRASLRELKLVIQILMGKSVLLVLSIAVMALGAVATAVDMLLHRRTIDLIVALSSDALRTLLARAAIMILLVVNSRALGLILTRLRCELMETLRLRAFSSAVREKLYGDDVMGTGEAYTIVMGDTERVASFFGRSIPAILSSLMTLIGTVAGMSYLDPVLLHWAILPVPIQFLIYQYRGRIAEALSRRQRELTGILNETTQELLNKRLNIKATKGEQWAINRFTGALKERLSYDMKAQRFAINLDTVSAIANAFVLTGLFVSGIQRVYASATSVGTLSAFVAYQGRLVSPFLEVYKAFVAFRVIQPNIERLAVVLEASKFTKDEYRTGDSNEVIVRDISIRGDAGRPDRLHKGSCEIPPSTIVGLVGLNGAGKTSMCLAISGLLRPYEGQLIVLGHHMKDHSWRSTFPEVHLIPQSAHLFSGSIRENICLDLNIDDKLLLEILNEVGLYDTVMALPKGLDTQLGELRSSLSGGEVQKLLIARALIRRPRLLILDEAMSAVATDDLPMIVKALRKHICQDGGRVLLCFHGPHLSEYCDLVFRLNGTVEGFANFGGEQEPILKEVRA